MASLPNIVWSAEAALPRLLTGVAMALAIAVPAAWPIAANAQDRASSPELEDLIPDSALDNPHAWVRAEADPAPEDGEQVVEIDPDTPLETLDAGPLGTEALAWPDEIELPPLDPVEPDEEIRFADLEIEGPGIAFAEAETVRITDELVLGFPQREPPFTRNGEFVERFTALSTIRELDTDEDNLAQLSARAREDEELLGNLLRAYGYYDGQVVRSIGGVEQGADRPETSPQVRFDVIPGTRYTYGAVDLGNLGAAPDAPVLRRSFEIKPGDPLDSDTIVSERYDLDRMLGETGYAFAAIEEPQLLIDHDRQEGDLTLAVEPGGKYLFGEVTSNDPQFLSGRHLGRIARFDAGDVYQRSLELDLRRAVTATGLVSTVTVTPREVSPPRGDAPGVVAMDVAVERADLRTIAGAIGYGSEEGFRIQASWEHRNFFPPEGLLRVRGILGTQEQLAGITFRRNNFRARDRVLTVDAFATTIDSPAFDARTVSLRASYEQLSTLLFQKPVSWSAGLELVATGERPPTVDGIVRPRETFFVAALPGYAQLDTSDDLLDPTRGFRIAARLSPEVSRTMKMQSFYLRARVDGSIYQRVTDKVVLAGRAAYGAIPGAALRAIAPSRRFYAGGGGSVRGYGFREIGPTDEFGDPTGGRSLVELAAEARIRTGFFDGAVSVVPFVDAGSVSPSVTPDFDEIKIGAGIGLRYNTGFGPIRVDVGVPLNPDPGDAPLSVYVSLGQAF